MKTKLTKKNRALLEQFILSKSCITCNIRRPYVVATCVMELPWTGIGIAKWNPNDSGVSKWEWNEPRGCDIAIGRAVIDLIRQMDDVTLSMYIALSIANSNTLLESAATVDYFEKAQ